MQDIKDQEIPVVFHNISNYEYHFIIKELAEEFKGQLECLGKKIEKYTTFSVPIQEQQKMIITYKIKFMDSIGYMAGLSSSQANTLA